MNKVGLYIPEAFTPLIPYIVDYNIINGVLEGLEFHFPDSDKINFDTKVMLEYCKEVLVEYDWEKMGFDYGLGEIPIQVMYRGVTVKINGIKKLPNENKKATT